MVEANLAVENFDGDMQKKGDDKAKYEAALNNTLAFFKKGEHASFKEKKAAEGKGIESLNGIFLISGANDSLLICFGLAL